MSSKTTHVTRRNASAGRVALLLGAVLLSGCAGMNEDECRSADWRLIGYEDGAAGRSATRIGEHRQACADYHVTPDMHAYREGREAGLQEYCRPQNGYRLGTAGKGYGGVCPNELDGEFRAAYDAGLRIHTARSQVSTTRKRIRHKQHELESIRKSYATMTNELISDGTPTARRAELVVEAAQNAKRQDQLVTEVHDLERELELQRQALAEIESEPQRW